MKCLALIGLLGLVPSVAAADDAGRGDAVFDSMSMDRHTPVSMFGIDIAYVVFDVPQPPAPLPESHLTAIGMTIGGHYVDPRSGVGGYVALPLSYLDIELPLFQPDSEFVIGNFELGGMFAKWFGPTTALVVHAGIALPTADDDGPGLLQALASSPRYGDLVQRAPNSTWLRLGASPMGRSGQLFWRADGGIDVEIDDDDNGGAISPVLRLSVGGGFDLTSATLLAELVTVIIDNDSDDESASTLSLGARFKAGTLFPGVSLILPLGFDDTYGDIDLAIAVSLAGRI
jgi:hypothetical protein